MTYPKLAKYRSQFPQREIVDRETVFSLRQGEIVL